MLLSVENLEVKYGNIQPLHGISFHVNEGEIVTLIGANGAGKTTSLHSICRLTPPEAPRVIAGDIKFRGESILKTRPSDIVKDLKMALVPEGRRIFGNLTVMENLELATYSRDKGLISNRNTRESSISSHACTSAASNAANPSRAESSRCSQSAAL